MAGIPDIPVEVRARIEGVLADIAAKYDICIIFAAESGSRAWNMASSDSDYDVRGLFTPNNPHLAATKRALHMSDAPPMDITMFTEDRMIDVSLWDVRKALSLLRDGKTAMLEWVRSPIQYIPNESWCGMLMNIAMHGGARGSIMRHYLGLMRSCMHANLKSEKLPTQLARDLAYASDAVASAANAVRKAIVQAQLESVATLAREANEKIEALAAFADKREPATLDTSLTAKQLCYILMPAIHLNWLLQHPDGLPPLNIVESLAEVSMSDEVRAEITGALAAKRNSIEKRETRTPTELLCTWLKDTEIAVKEALKKSAAVRVEDADLLALVVHADGGMEKVAL